jgi:hypothetical protein
VKAPYRPITGGFWWGDDSDALQSVLHAANKQFEKGARNLLVVVPRLPLPISHNWRVPLERAFIGETVIQVPIDTGTGGPVGSATFPFKQSGDFMKTWPTKTDQNAVRREPRHTRVGAVLCLNDYDDGPEVKHRAFMTHNPNAAVPLPRDLWPGIPDFSCQSGRWCWSDSNKRADRESEGASFWEVRSESEWLTDPDKFEREVRDSLRK